MTERQFGRFLKAEAVDWSDRESAIGYLARYARLVAGGRRVFDGAACRAVLEPHHNELDAARDEHRGGYEWLPQVETVDTIRWAQDRDGETTKTDFDRST